jgi:hypothetical protein
MPPAADKPASSVRRLAPQMPLMAAVIALVLSTCAQSFGVTEGSLLAGEAGRIRTASEPAPAGMSSPSALPPPALPTNPPPGQVPLQQQAHSQVTTPRAGPPADVDLQPVTALQPKVRLEGDADGRDLVQQALDVAGVAHATAITLGEMQVQAPTGSADVSVAAVDPEGFRVLTPQVTADAVDVWKRIIEGDAAFTHDVGYDLELELGGHVPVGEEGHTLRVGAYASNGVPPVAEAVVSTETARELGVEGREVLLVSITGDEPAEAVATRLAQATGLDAEVLEDPVPRQAFLTGADARQAFESFTYIDNGDGMIQIDPAWVRRNIASAEVPVFGGHVVCHRLLIPQLRGALQEVVDRGLDHLIDPRQYGGCWVPRHIDFNPSKPLSMHSWGLAVDFNVSTNQLGAPPQMDPRIVEIFESWGFVWGGRWRRPDGMHFELGALLQSPQG